MKQLLIVLLVVATIVALGIPSIQRAREAQARTDSVNSLKAIGLAAHSFHDIEKRLPFNGSAATVNGNRYSLTAVAGDPRSGSRGFQIAPYIYQNTMYSRGGSNVGVPEYLCPARRRSMTTDTPSGASATPPWSDYVINPWLNDNINGGGVTTTSAMQDNHRTLVGVTDGTSNTIFFGHGQIDPDDYWTTVATPGYMDTILIGGTTATALSSNPAAGLVTFARDSTETRTDAARGWGGPFEAGCLICMGDATVRMWPYSLQIGTFKDGTGEPNHSLATFLTPTGGEAWTSGWLDGDCG